MGALIDGGPFGPAVERAKAVSEIAGLLRVFSGLGRGEVSGGSARLSVQIGAATRGGSERVRLPIVISDERMDVDFTRPGLEGEVGKKEESWPANKNPAASIKNRRFNSSNTFHTGSATNHAFISYNTPS